MRRATAGRGDPVTGGVFQFTPVMRRATRIPPVSRAPCPVSIHARHATGDAYRREIVRLYGGVSIHARHATGDVFNLDQIEGLSVSIHARHATGDFHLRRTRLGSPRFNSRPSCDGRPVLLDGHGALLDVSIHARHATGDIYYEKCRRRDDSFNSRPSCDGRLWVIDTMSPPELSFNSRPSCDGRHRAVNAVDVAWAVSIHARHATGDAGTGRGQDGKRTFQFTPVMRRATSPDRQRRYRRICFNSRPSCDGRLGHVT